MPEHALPCPFCGAENPRLYQSGGYWKVKCVNGCQVAISGYPKKERALEVWNRRPDGAGEMLIAVARVLQFTRSILEGTYDRQAYIDAALTLSELAAQVSRGDASKPPTSKLTDVLTNYH